MADLKLPPGATLVKLPPGATLVDDGDSSASRPMATMSAQPNTIANWLQNLEGDFRQGGGETLPGKILKFLGAPGLERGIPESVANTAGGPLVGPVTTAQGVNAMRTDPWQGLMRTLEGVGQTTFPAQLAFAPKAAAAVPQVAKGLTKVRPSIVTDLMKQYAGRALSEVEQAAKDVPVDPNAAGEVALRIKELTDAGSRPPGVVSKFLARVTNPEKGALTFREARDFYSNASRVSADEFNRLTPKVQRLVGRFTSALNESITAAANTVGQGDKYSGAMGNYAKAFAISKAGQKVVDSVIKPALKAGIIGSGGAAGYDIYRQLFSKR